MEVGGGRRVEGPCLGGERAPRRGDEVMRVEQVFEGEAIGRRGLYGGEWLCPFFCNSILVDSSEDL